MHSAARPYHERKRLDSSFFFTRENLAKRNQNNLFSVDIIARDLSDYDPRFKTALWGVVKEAYELRASPRPMEQLNRLIIEPGREFYPARRKQRASRNHIFISEKIANDALLTYLRFLITARTEADIIASLLPSPRIVHKLKDDVPQETVNTAIIIFIQHALYKHFDFNSAPDKERCRRLVNRAEQPFCGRLSLALPPPSFNVSHNPRNAHCFNASCSDTASSAMSTSRSAARVSTTRIGSLASAASVGAL